MSRSRQRFGPAADWGPSDEEFTEGEPQRPMTGSYRTLQQAPPVYVEVETPKESISRLFLKHGTAGAIVIWLLGYFIPFVLVPRLDRSFETLEKILSRMVELETSQLESAQDIARSTRRIADQGRR